MNIEALSSSSTAYDTSYGFSDATYKVTSSSSSSSSSNKLSPPNPCPRPSNSFAGGEQYLTPPKRSISKPLKRPSRASKRTPTTLLNADPKDFRALVQQFTSCRRLSTSISFGNHPGPRSAGPVNINFALGKEQAAYHVISANDHASNLQPLIDHNDCSPESQLQYYNQQVANEEQECEFSLDSITVEPDLHEFLSTPKSSPCFPSSGAEMQIPEGLVMDMDDLFFPCMNY